MSSNPIRLQQLLRKYLDNKCSKAELKEFWQLLSELSENDLMTEELKALWDDSQNITENTRVTQKGKHLARILKKEKEGQIDFEKIHRRNNKKWVWARIAAIFLVIVSLATFLLLRTSKNTKDEIATVPDSTNSVFASHKILTLPDGTKVTVNLNTKLEFPKEFTGNTRDVYLSGEAFFDVAHDSTKPFLVHTGLYTTRVLGTKFNINAYPGNNQITVTVSQGKVQVEDKQAVIKTLLPSDQLVIEKSTGIASHQKVDIIQATEWKDEDLVFDNISFEDAAMVISKRYNVSIEFNNESIRQCRFTSTFFSSNGLDQVLDILTTITNTTWVKENEKLITIEGEGCKNQ